MRVSELIDPDNMVEIAFFDLYNEIQDDRHNKPEKTSKCTIF